MTPTEIINALRNIADAYERAGVDILQRALMRDAADQLETYAAAEATEATQARGPIAIQRQGAEHDNATGGHIQHGQQGESYVLGWADKKGEEGQR